ncbi:hypothetical protein BDV34DRAFT_100067 [Aspergillus parasiticus]|uniref:Uncharacterized protein n=1 Tax=Aspergillus parasiticus TaxID=5067 RepID=A0A5N6DLY3_ASPPA|nr:hypothetical protein BDV34DRAFT_100067 [Aspergillus parasiticus]
MPSIESGEWDAILLMLRSMFYLGLKVVLLLSRYLTPNGWGNGLCRSTTRSKRLDHSTASAMYLYNLGDLLHQFRVYDRGFCSRGPIICFENRS